MSKKPTDWNDLPDEARELFDSLEGEAEKSNISALENFNAEIKFMNELNSKHLFVNSMGGKSFVTHRIWSEVTEREELEFLPLDTFKNIYLNKTIKATDTRGNSIAMPVGNWWLADTRRATVDSVIFDPSSSESIVERGDRRYLNLWEGFGVKPFQGSWARTQRHIYTILCNSDPDKFRYVVKWLAWAVQNPDKRAEVAIVFKGEKGGGKSFLFAQMKKIFGSHGMVITDPNRLVGKFNGHLRKMSFIFCDEVYYPGNKEIEGIIKARITEEFMDVESKFGEATSIKNRLHIAMCTNNDWVVPATKDERRYFIESINNKYAKGNCPEHQRIKYFNALWSEMDNGGREAMLYDLMRMDLTGWHPREDVPDTLELTRQKEMSLNPLLQAFKQMLDDALFPGEYIRTGYHIQADVLYGHLEKIEPKSVKFSMNRKAEIVKKLGGIKERGAGGRIRWAFPELHEVRKNWNKNIMISYWDNERSWHLIKSDF